MKSPVVNEMYMFASSRCIMFISVITSLAYVDMYVKNDSLASGAVVCTHVLYAGLYSCLVIGQSWPVYTVCTVSISLNQSGLGKI